MTPSQQGKKGRPPASAQPAPQRGVGKTVALGVFGVLFIALFAVIALGTSLGDPSVPSDDIAVVEDAPDGTITKEEFDGSLQQTATSQGLKEVPEASDPQYQQLRDAAIADLILSRWVLGEAEERGIEVSEREIDTELETVIQQQFGSEKAFDKFLEESGFTEEEARERIKLQLISDRIQSSVLPGSTEQQQDPVQLAADLGITDEEIETYYDENIDQFETPETRDVRVITTKTEDDAAEVLAALEEDNSPKSFEAVAKKYSIDEATKNTGGLREAVVEGQSEPALDEAIFSSPEGELVGPLEGDAGFYVLQVDAVTPAATQALDPAEGADPEDPSAIGARDQIQQTLVAARQQEVAQRFQDDFTEKWKARTFCASGYEVDRCSNGPPLPDVCTDEIAESTGCPAVVLSRPVAAPGSRGVFGTPTAALVPQGPITPAPATVGGEQLPPGLVPTQPGQAPPPGAAPPQQAPPGAAPTAPPAP